MSVNAFQKLEKIGEGTYGIVYKAKEKSTGKIVALKKIRPESENEGIPSTTIREIVILKNLKHPSIIDLIEVIHSDDKMYLVFEYMETDLRQLMKDFIKAERRFPAEIAKKMCFQLFSAIDYCHRKGIFHRDLKPQNILVDSNFNVKIADFGLSRAATIPLRQYTLQIVTLWYRAPELLLGHEIYDHSVDTWSLGCIMAEIYLMKPLFMGDSEVDQLHKIFGILGTPSKSDWACVQSLPKYPTDIAIQKKIPLSSIIDEPEVALLLEKIFKYDPIKRISAKDVLESRFFEDFELPIEE